MAKSDQLAQLLSQAHFHLLAGDFELCEELLNKAEIELKDNDETDPYITFNMVKADLYRSTGRRELCFTFWDKLLQRSENDMQRCICYSEKALGYMKIGRYKDIEHYKVVVGSKLIGANWFYRKNGFEKVA